MSDIVRIAKQASSFEDFEARFLWYPYLPIGDYSVIMAAGGTGKTMFCSGIAAAVTRGNNLPGDNEKREPQNVLFISAEDTGGILRTRLSLSGADLDRCFIIDCQDSVGMNIAKGINAFRDSVMACQPALVIIDPWHAFLGDTVNIDRVNVVRPILQQLANLAKACDCAIVCVSHVNKKAQGENANNAATGSSDFVNAARSAMQLIFDDENRDERIMVHTKSNYAGYGRSVKFLIDDGGLEWSGFSDITRQTLESAARRRCTPAEAMQKVHDEEEINTRLIDAIKASTKSGSNRFTYEEFKAEYGEWIFGGLQPKRALDAVAGRLDEEGYHVRTGIRLNNENGTKSRGFHIQCS